MNQYSLNSQVRQTIEPLLIAHGFALTSSQEDPFDVLIYDRESDRSRVTIHNDREMAIHAGEARLFVGAYAQGSGLMSLKELLPNFLVIPVLERGQWTYRNQEELSTCIEEIIRIIKNRLFDWFKEPVSNPAKVPLPTALKMTPDKLLLMIKSQEYSAEQARKEGRLEDLERIEHSLDAMKISLKRMLASEDDSSM